MRYLLFSFIPLFFLTGCNKLTQFEMPYSTTVVIPSQGLIDLPLSLSSPEVTTSSEQKFAVEDTRKDLIETIFLATLDLTVEQPSQGDFSILKDIEIFLSSENISETKIAWKNNIPENQDKTLSLETTNDDLQEYIKADEFSLRVTTTTRKTFTQDHEIKVDAVFDVDAKLTK